MIWVDREVNKLKDRKLPLEWVDDMKTPSGRIHVGALRGVLIHDLMYKALFDNDVKVKYTYVFNDFDQMDAVPTFLEYSKWQEHEGKPLFHVPSPEPGFASFAEYFAKEFINVFESINCHPEIIWSSKLYLTGKMNTVIKEILDAGPAVRKIYAEVTKAHKPDNWYPFQAICENCGKIATTVTYDWDGKHVYYHCQPHLVKWTKGCDHKGKVTPYDGHGKLHWRLDWPAHWKVIGVTIEGSGKDHMSSGGSYDFAKAVCEQVLKIPTPYAIPYEWFTVGGRKMSSSKGIGTTAKDITEILPPDVLRFLIVRTPIGTALDFNPYGETIPRLFDDYDRCLNAHFDVIENKTPDGKMGEVTRDFARIMKLSEVRPLPDKRLYIPRFRTLVNLIKNNSDLVAFTKKQKGEDLNSEEKEILEEREIYAQKYIKEYETQKDPAHHNKSLNDAVILTSQQKEFLKNLVNELKKTAESGAEHFQTLVFSTIKVSGLKPKEAFSAIYFVLTGEKHGPKVGELIASMTKEKTIEKLTAA